MNRREKEIRTILMGFVRYEGNYCLAADNILKTRFIGLNNGSGAARLRGLKEYRTQYHLQSGKLMGNMPIVNALLAMGVPVFLNSAPDASAILHRHWLLNPVLITFEDNKKDALICFYTAKTFFAGAVIRRCMKKLVAKFPEDFTVAELTMKPFVADEPEEEKKQKKSGVGKKKQKQESAAENSAENAESGKTEEQKAETAEPAPESQNPEPEEAEPDPKREKDAEEETVE